MLSNTSIRTKIISLVSLLLLAIVGMGLLAARSMQSLNANTYEIATNWLPSVRALGELHVGVVGYRGAVQSHLVAETIETKEAVEKEIASIVERNTKLQKTYEAMISSPEERSLYEEWSKSWLEYENLVTQVIGLSRKEAGRVPHEAIMLNMRASDVAKKADDILQKKIEHNNLGAAQETKTAAAVYLSSVSLLALIIIVAIALGAGVSFYVIRDVSRGIASIASPMQALGAGDLTTEVPHRGKKTELGMMADALQVFKEALIAKQEADKAASEDAEAKIQRSHRVDAITREFEEMIETVVHTVSSASAQLEASAGMLSSTAMRSEELSTLVANASEEASTNVQSVASATEELSSSVTEIGRQVQESARMATEAVDQAHRTTERVNELSDAAARIGDVVELINKIAGQTNLLALNATIEAARAGETGRGFSVVASEVKALAAQTAKATDEIGRQISGIQAATQESVGAIQAISATIERLSEISSAIAAAVEEQGAATREISRNVQQAAQGTQQVSSNIVDVQRGTTETNSASSEMLSAAQGLSADSNRLKVEVSKFLTSVRTA